MKITKRSWPVLIVSGQFNAQNDEGCRLGELTEELKNVQYCSVIPSFAYEDAHRIFVSRADLGAIVVDWELPEEDPEEKMTATEFIDLIRQRNKKIPIFILKQSIIKSRLML